ncbi:MAG: MaoC family dehydratase [Melioribacteraceae bacterium]
MKEIIVGQKTSTKKVFCAEEVRAFALSSQDSNPIHLDEEYASKTFFKKPIVHGMLVASLFGGMLGSELPGNGTIYLGQTIKFLKPNFVGEEITAIIEIIDIRVDKPIYTLSTKCYNASGDLTIDGEAVIMYKGELFK